MDDSQFYTLAFLATYGGATSALRLYVEYTKGFVGEWFTAATGREFNTFVYALFVSYVLVYGTGALTDTLGKGMWFAHIFNGLAVAVVAGAMQRQSQK
jgi:hypothetical protein